MRLRSQNKCSSPSESVPAPMVDVILTLLAFSIIIAMSLASQFQASKANDPDEKIDAPHVEAVDLKTCQAECDRAN
ncbi:hypothetical protein [Phormidesmis priestleyi]